jgi:OOP family OmpA-OmpF porin
MTVRKCVLSLAAVLITAALPLSAADTGFYVGAGIGLSSLDVYEFYPTLGDAIENGDLAYKAYGGYRFSKFLAVEGSYALLGSPQWQERNVLGNRETAEVSVKGWDAFVVGILPVSKSFDIFAKVGLIAWDTEITSVRIQEVIFSESESGTDPAYGLGFGWWVGTNVTLRLEGEVLTIGDYDDVGQYSVGVSYTF